ncbi:MAG TPA: phytanoyl-CoA dioxygenase family protein [Acidimicrobiales bacterium]
MSAAGVRHLPSTAASEDIHDVLLSEGAVIVDDLVDVPLVARVREELAPFIEVTPFGSDGFAGRRTRRTGALVARSPACRELVRNALVLDVAGRLLHKAVSFQLHLTQAIAIGPGEPAQAVHRDQWAFDFYPFPTDYHVQCNTIWALTEFTEANGATRVIPGSQDWPDAHGHSVEETVPAEMSPGSCLFYTGKVYHGGGANTTDEVRIAGNITYAVGWLRQEENQYLSLPREVAETLDDDLLRLMGYRIGAYALGYIDDVRDPLEAIRGARGGMSLGDLDVARSQR